ncbi:hypothetical protein J3459_010279 [Metarhizium acridum]|nr:hypothetical protein J3459_010279 [Metarhizium acridum]
MFMLKPPTAGYRKLDLSGSTPDQLLHFLHEIHRAARPIGAEISLRDYFDVLEASDSGIFCVLALFAEGWTISECKHHLPGLTDFTATPARVTFGKSIYWDLPQIWHCNGSKFTFNPSKETLTNEEHSRTNRPSAQSLSLRYGGESYTSYQLKTAAEQLFCSLFFIELNQPPAFYTSPDTCVVDICCRIQPSPALSRILAWLQTNRIRIKYEGDEFSSSEAMLYTDDVFRRCLDGTPFRRTLSVKAYSLDTLIKIQFGPFNGRFYDISGCPYKLGHLIKHHEQGWFMNSQGDGQCDKIGSVSVRPLQQELDRLIETIRLIL